MILVENLKREYKIPCARARDPSDPINEPPKVWLLLNFQFLVFLFALGDSHDLMANVIEGTIGYAALAIFFISRTVLDYGLSKPFYFGSHSQELRSDDR